jgi:hypothetical protein
MTPAQKKLAELKSLVEAKHPYYSAPFSYADALKLIEALETAVSALAYISEDRLYTDHYGSAAKSAVWKQVHANKALASIESILGGG